MYWFHVIRDNRLARSVPFVGEEASIGSRMFCDLVLDGLAGRHGRFLIGTTKQLEFHPDDGSAVQVLRDGDHLSLGPYVLAIEVRRDLTSAVQPLLRRLLELMPRIWQGEDSESVLPVLLDSLLTMFGTDWGAIVSVQDRGNAPSVLHRSGRRPGGGPDAISQTVIQQVLARREAVLVADVQADPALSRAESIPFQVRSVIAAPLESGTRLLGIVYLESPVSARTFTETEQELLGLICRFAADHLERAGHARALALANEGLGRALSSHNRPETLVAASPAMLGVIEEIQRVGPTDVTTLVLGETGTGKEVVARAIHHASPRRDMPFVAVNCMALADDLVEGELFGHVKGAFSGASSDRVGRFEMAHRGTLFLDEVGELSPRLQVKLLRVLQERVIQRVGENRDRPVDVRLIAATNADLAALVARGSFREDLFYRVSVFVLRLPPLRARIEDAMPLVDHLIESFNRRFRRDIRGVEPGARDALLAHTWPGNIRELRNVIEQAFVRETSDWITSMSLSLPPSGGAADSAGRPGDPPPEELGAAVVALERKMVLSALEREKGNVLAAARRLKISRGNLYKKCAQLGIEPDRIRGS